MRLSFFLLVILFQIPNCQVAYCQIAPPCDIDVATYPVGNRPIVIAHGDLNADARDDVVVGNDSPQTPVAIMLSNEQGDLEPIQTLPVVSPRSIAIGDLNSDANADIAIGAAISFDSEIYVFTNMGGGEFIGPITIEITGLIGQLRIADVNLDGHSDIVAMRQGGPGNGHLEILLGDGLGGFDILPATEVGFGAFELRVQDLSADGIPDVVTGATNGMYVLLGNGDGSFQPAEFYFTEPGPFPNSIAVGDVDADSDVDVAVTNYDDSEVEVFLNNGAGVFGSSTIAYDGLFTRPVQVEMNDLNNDGSSDLLISFDFQIPVSVILSDGSGTFEEIQYNAGITPFGLATPDLNNDQIPEIAAINRESDTLTILFGNKDGTFPVEPLQFKHADTDAFFSEQISLGDVNNDSNLDILTSSFGIVEVLLGDGFGGFESDGMISNQQFQYFALSEFDGDSILDLAVVVTSPAGIQILHGNGAGGFVPGNIFAMQTVGPVTTADINGDGLRDLVMTDAGLRIRLGTGNGQFGELETFFVPGVEIESTVGDLNSDGFDDIVVRTADSVELFFGDATGGLSLPQSYDTTNSNQDLVLGDFNGDTALDFAVVGNTNAISFLQVFLNDGLGVFELETSYREGFDPASLCTLDIDQDGNLDLATVRAQMEDVTVFLGSGNGSFYQSANRYFVGDQPLQIEAGDIDGDLDDDLIVANSTDSFISLLQNLDCKIPFLLGDVNQDGVVDLLDIAPFVAVLSSSGFQEEADINDDGVVDLLDVGPFVDILTGN